MDRGERRRRIGERKQRRGNWVSKRRWTGEVSRRKNRWIR